MDYLWLLYFAPVHWTQILAFFYWTIYAICNLSQFIRPKFWLFFILDFSCTLNFAPVHWTKVLAFFILDFFMCLVMNLHQFIMHHSSKSFTLCFDCPVTVLYCSQTLLCFICLELPILTLMLMCEMTAAIKWPLKNFINSTDIKVNYHDDLCVIIHSAWCLLNN